MSQRSNTLRLRHLAIAAAVLLLSSFVAAQVPTRDTLQDYYENPLDYMLPRWLASELIDAFGGAQTDCWRSGPDDEPYEFCLYVRVAPALEAQFQIDALMESHEGFYAVPDNWWFDTPIWGNGYLNLRPTTDPENRYAYEYFIGLDSDRPVPEGFTLVYLYMDKLYSGDMETLLWSSGKGWQ